MALQKVVGYPAVAFEGQHIAFGQQAYTVENFVSDGTAQIGKFAFRKTVENTGTAVVLNVASATGADSDIPLGIVEKAMTAAVINSATPDVYPAGAEITIAIRGDFAITAPATANLGDKVLVKPTDGSISFGASAGTGTVDTGWVVTRAGAKDDVIYISNHG